MFVPLLLGCDANVSGPIDPDFLDGVPREHYRLFTTSGAYGVSTVSGIGVSARDEVCRQEAIQSGLRRSYRALVVGAAIGLSARFDMNRPISVVVQGHSKLLIESLQASIDGASLLIEPRYSGMGDLLGTPGGVATGISITGGIGATCLDWVSSSIADSFAVGSMVQLGMGWLSSSAAFCSSTSQRLYCLGAY